MPSGKESEIAIRCIFCHNAFGVHPSIAAYHLPFCEECIKDIRELIKEKRFPPNRNPETPT